MKQKQYQFGKFTMYLLSLILLFTIAVTASCGGGSGNGGGTSGGGAEPTAATAVIDSAGGTLTGPDGVQVVVPAGALDQTTTIGIAISSAGAPTSFPENYTPAGSIYEFTPHDVIFNAPVTIRMPVPANAVGTEIFMASPGGDWQVYDTTVTGNVAEWQRNSFSWGSFNFFCSIPASNTDPYYCWLGPDVWSNASATPASAITLTGYAWPIDQRGNALSWVVNQASTVHLSVGYRAVPDCVNARLKLSRVNPAGLVQTLFDQSVTMLPEGTNRAVGSTTIDAAFSYLDNGTTGFYYSFTCKRPNSSSTRTGGDWSIFVADIPVPSVYYTIGGSVSGLTGTGLVLQNNGGDNLPVLVDSAFTFATSVGAGSPYNVTVFTQPTGQTCTVANGSNTANANVTNVAVSCSSLAISPINPTAVGCSTDTVTFTASGGAQPYSWSTSEGGSTNLTVINATQAQWDDSSDNFCGINSGTVTITVTDSVGATASATINVTGG